MLIHFSSQEPYLQENILSLGRWISDESTTSLRYRFISNSDSHQTDKTQIEVGPEQVTLSRSGSAEVPLFYYVYQNDLFVSDSVYVLQQQVQQPIDHDAAYQYIYSQFLPQEKTLFQHIFQVLNQQTLSFSVKNGKIDCQVDDSFDLPMQEFVGMDEQALTTTLRQKIMQAHGDRLGSDNAIFLSGGLDSQVMSITLSKDLSLGNRLTALHFSVKNARQSELEDARLTADTLAIPFHAVEIDPENEVDFASLVKMNAPYIGAISISQLLGSADLAANTTVFAGQDTRLHTPFLQAIDEKILTIYRLPFSGLVISGLARIALKTKMAFNNEFESKLYRKLAFFNGTNTTSKYLTNRFFHTALLPFQSSSQVNALQQSIANELAQVSLTNKRDLFNTVVKQLWRRQFLYDINYMHDTIGVNHGKVAMPFYDVELANYSAQLPFDLAAKVTKGRAGHGATEVSVNKYLLRKAYEGELDDSLVYRDKAVCLTAHMFFNGGLKHELEAFIDAGWLSGNEDAQNLHLSELQTLCKSKHRQWQEEDHWLMMMVFNALVIFHHLRDLG